MLDSARERLAWASMLVHARASRRWQTSVRRAHATYRYSVREGIDLELDLYLPDERPAPVPLIVWLHGGAWREGSRADVAPLVARQVERGFAVASVSYSLTPVATWPVQAHEIKAAVRWLRSRAGELGLDPGRFVAWGLSAGAHLASMLGVTGDRELEGDLAPGGESSAVQGVVAWYGPSELATMGRNSIMDHDAPDAPESQLIGGPVPRHLDLAARASPVHYVDGRPLPPFLLVHGTIDPIVPFAQSSRLHEVLVGSGASSTLVPVRLGTHVDLRCNTGPARRAAEAFIDAVG